MNKNKNFKISFTQLEEIARNKRDRIIFGALKEYTDSEYKFKTEIGGKIHSIETEMNERHDFVEEESKYIEEIKQAMADEIKEELRLTEKVNFIHGVNDRLNAIESIVKKTNSKWSNDTHLSKKENSRIITSHPRYKETIDNYHTEVNITLSNTTRNERLQTFHDLNEFDFVEIYRSSASVGDIINMFSYSYKGGGGVPVTKDFVDILRKIDYQVGTVEKSVYSNLWSIALKYSIIIRDIVEEACELEAQHDVQLQDDLEVEWNTLIDTKERLKETYLHDVSVLNEKKSLELNLYEFVDKHNIIVIEHNHKCLLQNADIENLQYALSEKLIELKKEFQETKKLADLEYHKTIKR